MQKCSSECQNNTSSGISIICLILFLSKFVDAEKFSPTLTLFLDCIVTRQHKACISMETRVWTIGSAIPVQWCWKFSIGFCKSYRLYDKYLQPQPFPIIKLKFCELDYDDFTVYLSVPLICAVQCEIKPYLNIAPCLHHSCHSNAIQPLKSSPTSISIV